MEKNTISQLLQFIVNHGYIEQNCVESIAEKFTQFSRTVTKLENEDIPDSIFKISTQEIGIENSIKPYEQTVPFHENRKIQDISLFRKNLKKNILGEGTFAHYKIIKQLGAGGMGIVYKAKDLKLGREVALKIIKDSIDSSNMEERFMREAQAMASLSHSNIVPIYEIGEYKTIYYYTMQCVEGSTLFELIKKKTYTLKEFLAIVKKVALAVEYAHKNGIIHRDLKPANIMVDSNKEPYVLDFGLAKLLKSNSISVSGAIIGTLAYMSPEQADGKGKQIDHSSDIYSLGAILYETITGRPPFQGNDTINIIYQILERDPILPRRLVLGIPYDVETVCLKCLEKQKNRRYKTSGALAKDIENCLAGRPITARPASFSYRLFRLMMRNKISSFIISTMLCTLIFFVVTIINYMFQLKDEKIIAKKNATRANKNARVAEESKKLAFENLAKAYLNLGKYQENLSNYTYASLCYAKMIKTLKQCHEEKVKILLNTARCSLWRSYLQLIPNEKLGYRRRQFLPLKIGNASQYSKIVYGIDPRLSICNVYSGESFGEFQGVTAAAFDFKSTLALSGVNKTLWLWDIKKRKLIKTLPSPSSIIKLLFSRDGKYLIALSSEKAYVWNVHTHKVQTSFDISASSICLSQNSQYLIIGRSDGIEIWDIEQNLLLNENQIDSTNPSGEDIYRISSIKDDTFIVCVYQNRIEVKKRKNWENIFVYKTEKEISNICIDEKVGNIFIASDTNTITICNIHNHNQIKKITPKIGNIYNISLHPSRKLLAIASQTHFILWSLRKNTLYQTFKKITGEIDDIFFHTDRYMSILRHHKKMRLYDKKKQILSEYKLKKDVHLLAIQKKNVFFAIAQENNVKIYNIKEKILLHDIELGVQASSILFHPEKAEIFIGTYSGELYWYELLPALVRKRYKKVYDSRVALIHIRKDARKLLTVGEGENIHIWDLKSWKHRDIHNDIFPLKISPDGNYILIRDVFGKPLKIYDFIHEKFVHLKIDKQICSYVDGVFRREKILFLHKDRKSLDLWSYRPFKYISTFRTRKSSIIESMSLSVDGNWITCLDKQRNSYMWEAETQKLHKIIKTGNYSKFHPHFPNTPLIMETNEFSKLSIREGFSGDILHIFEKLDEYAKVNFTKDGTSIIFSNNNRITSVLNIKDMKQKIFSQHNGGIFHIQFNKDSSLLASGSYDGTIRVWNIHSGKLLFQCSGHNATDFHFSLDVKWLAFIASNDSLILRNCKDQSILTTKNHSSYAPIAFSHNSKYLASSEKNALILMDLEEVGSWRHYFYEEKAQIYKILFSHDNKFVGAILFPNTIALWNVATKKLIKQWKVADNNEQTIENICFSQDGRFLASSGQDRLVRIWNIKEMDAKPLILKGAHSTVDTVKFLKNFIVTGSRDSWLRIWDFQGKIHLKIYGYTWGRQTLGVFEKFNIIAFIDEKNELQVWDIKEKKQIGRFFLRDEKIISINVQGDYLALGGDKRKLYLHKIDEVYALLKMSDRKIEEVLEQETGFSLNQFQLIDAPPQWKK